MADLRVRERGQLMLVSALALAVLFVALAVVLNTVIFTENLATRSSDIAGGADATRYAEAVREGVGGSVRYANYHNNSSQSDLDANITENVDRWGNLSGFVYAINSRGINVTHLSTSFGSRIYQANDRALESSSTTGSASDWTLASDVSNTRRFRMNLTRSSLNKTDTDGVFRVILDDGSDEWRLNVSRDESTSPDSILVGVNATNAPEGVCDGVQNTRTSINLSAGTVGGSDCSVIDFAAGLSPPYEIRFKNGDNATGTYTFVVDNTSILGINLNLNDGTLSSDDPRVTDAIYAVEIRAIYESRRIAYNTTIRVAPGEPE